MLELPGYELGEQLHVGQRSVVWRARRREDGQSVVVKTTPTDWPTPRAVARLETELALLQRVQSDRVVRAYGCERVGHRPVLVTQDYGGEALARHGSLPLPVDQAARIGAQVAEALGALHEAGVVHRDITLANVLHRADSGEVKIIDLGIATPVPREQLAFTHPSCVEGTLAYISPEQTGRMNRPVDYRTDYYSLGVCLFELLTGRLPFVSDDPAELVYCHVAQNPPRVAALCDAVPEQLADVVARLMAKAAEHRFQSAAEIIAALAPFSGQRSTTTPASRPPRFELSNTLCGRELEKRALTLAFERAAAGSRDLLLVSGEPGVGKTALAAALVTPVSAARAWFASGKFEQLRRDVPHVALREGLRDVVRQRLTGAEATLAAWKQRLSDDLGDDVAQLVDWIPELEHSFAGCPPLLALPADAAKARFERVAKALVRSFTRPDAPLVLFLDDLQWADESSLLLLEALLCDGDAHHLLVVGAFRSADVGGDHPVRIAVPRIERGGAHVEQLELHGLAEAEVAEMLASVVALSAASNSAVATELWRRTAGNPLFIRELLRSLHRSGAIRYDADGRHWTLDAERVLDGSTPDSVVDLLSARLRELDGRRVLSRAACIGGRFDLDTLATIVESSPADLAQALLPAVDAGVIVVLGEGLGQASLGHNAAAPCRFAHDHIQRAAYELLDADERRRIHGALGKRLLERNDGIEERLFEIADHLNAALDLLDEGQRLQGARINLRAARRARASSAHAIARNHADAGLRALGADTPDDAEHTRFELSYERCHALAMLEVPLEELESACRSLIHDAPARLERLRAQTLLVQQLGPRGSHEAAIELGLAALEDLGVDLLQGDPADAAQRGWRALQAELDDRAIEQVVAQLAPTTAVDRILVEELYGGLGTSVWATRFDLVPVMSLHGALGVLQHGTTPLSPQILTGAGFVLAHLLDDYDVGHAFGKAGTALAERMGSLRGGDRHLFTYFLSWFKTPFRQLADGQVRAFREARAAGNLQMAGHAAAAVALHLWRANLPLTELLERIAPYDDYLQRIDHYYAAALNDVRQAAKNLLGDGSGGPSLSDADYDQDRVASQLEAIPSPPGLRMHFLMRAELELLYGQYEAAFASLERARACVTPGEYNVQEGMFYWGVCAAQTGAPEAADLPQLVAHLEPYAHRIIPDNFLNRWTLLCAEAARLSGRDAEAERQFERAIDLSRQFGLQRDEGIAAELAARFYLARERKTQAHALLQRARAAFDAWGAVAKVARLHAEFPDLGPVVAPRPAAGPGRAPTESGRLEHAELDVRDLLEASQAISAEMDVGSVVERLMRIARHSAGAASGALAMARNGDLWVVGRDGAQRPLAEANDVPIALVRYVARTREEVALDDACADPIFKDDPHVRRFGALSVFCTPLVVHGDLVGVLYLQNEQLSGAFGAERHEIIRALGAQAAISINNARLYGDKQNLAARLATILDTVGDGVITIDENQTIRMVNREIERIFGYGRAELLGRPVRTIMPEKYRAEHDAAFAKRLADEAPMPARYVEVEGLRRGREVFPLELRFAQAQVDGEVLYTGALRDITQRVRAREEIERLSKALEQERDYLREEVKASGQFGEIVGESSALKMVLAQVEAVAKTNATVLILGESGVGKELIARAIHERSPRAQRALVKVNCASVPRELFESEFFGHRKGAFTGAVRDRIGRFQLAHEGTIFLDEVGEIPLELQSKLLRVLQEQEFERVGDDRTQTVDVRVVAATNRDLRQDAQQGQFREDLYYRLGVFPIRVPPLRERREDIVPLALHFLGRAVADLNMPAPKLLASVAARLEDYPWPGNIRELQNVMERAAILAGGGTVTEGMLYLDRRAATPPTAAPAPDHPQAVDTAPKKSGVDAHAIRQALEQHNGNIARVASALGLSRQALYRRMEKFGIERPRRDSSP